LGEWDPKKMPKKSSNPKEFSAEYINCDDDYKLMSCMGSINLVYGRPDKRKWKAIAFKDNETARKAAYRILVMVETLELGSNHSSS
jgi:hypothetical protein